MALIKISSINTIYYTTLKANIEFGLRNEETKKDIKEYLKNLDIEKI